MKNLLESLMSMGLTKNQAKVYLVVLDNGKILLADIAKKTSIKRSTCVNYVEDLLKLGYLSKTIAGKRIAYIAESPEDLLKQYELKQEKFRKNLPEFNKMFLSNSRKANVVNFEGLSGIRKEYHRISTGFKPIITFFSMERYLKVLDTDDMNKFIGNIMKNENTIKDLMEDTPKTREIMKNRKFNGKFAKYLPKTFPVGIDLIIQGDNVTMISFDKLMGVTIENKEIADFHRQLHSHFWDLLDLM